MRRPLGVISHHRNNHMTPSVPLWSSRGGSWRWPSRTPPPPDHSIWPPLGSWKGTTGFCVPLPGESDPTALAWIHWCGGKTGISSVLLQFPWKWMKGCSKFRDQFFCESPRKWCSDLYETKIGVEGSKSMSRWNLEWIWIITIIKTRILRRLISVQLLSTISENG